MMNKKLSAIIIMFIIILVLTLVIVLTNRNTSSNRNTTVEGSNNNVTEIRIDEEAWIDSLTEINIKNTNDYFKITKNVKWEIPESNGATTISFVIQIPYTFVADGILYTGTYELGDNPQNNKEDDLKYNIEILDLTSEGKIKVKITK